MSFLTPGWRWEKFPSVFSLLNCRLKETVKIFETSHPGNIIIQGRTATFFFQYQKEIFDKNIFLLISYQEDLAFWGIDELSLQACCSLKYYSQISSCQSELEEERSKRSFDVSIIELFEKLWKYFGLIL